MKKAKTLISLLLTLTLLAGITVVTPLTANAAANTWNPGAGVYDISTEDDLYAFRDDMENNTYNHFEGKTIVLNNDIHITNHSQWKTVPTYNSSWTADINWFSGTFDGNNKTIYGLNVDGTGSFSCGFLPGLKGASLKNLTLSDITVTADSDSETGAFSGQALEGENIISNCHITGNSIIKTTSGGDNTSAFIGYAASEISISGCTLGDNVKIIGNYAAGGFVGFANGDISITDSVNSAHVEANGSLGYYQYEGYAGGFVGLGYNVNIKISDSTNNGNIVVDSNAFASDRMHNEYVGGFVGATISCVFQATKLVNYGSVSSELNLSGSPTTCSVGGIIAFSDLNSTANIDTCANHGSITEKAHQNCTDVGGVIGGLYAKKSYIINCYNTGTINAVNADAIGGVAGLYFSSKYAENGHGDSILKNCYNTGTVTIQASDSSMPFIGGVLGMINSDKGIEEYISVENIYNFGTVNNYAVRNDATGQSIGYVQYASTNNIFSPIVSTSKSIGVVSAQSTAVDNYVGYFDSADTDGNITSAYSYYTTDISGLAENETVIYTNTAPTPNEYTVEKDLGLTGKNLLDSLNEWVKAANKEAGEETYLTWKMTNPASEDGSKGVSVHPMFGVESTTVDYHINNDDKSDIYTDDIFTPEVDHDVVIGETIQEFHNIPKLKDPDGYIFKGWYYEDGTPVEFGVDKYEEGKDIYAQWEPVAQVEKDPADDKILPASMNGKYSNFGLFGVQLRPEDYIDKNIDSSTKQPGGLRFITSISESLLNELDSLSAEKKLNGNTTNYEYGYVAARRDQVDQFASHYGKTTTDYELKYNGTDVNGEDTTGTIRDADHDYRYITNVDCTSNSAKVDHKSFANYRLSTFVVTYSDEESAQHKDDLVCARAYLRYYDANGLLRTFYNDYSGTTTYGGCCTSYNEAASHITAENTDTYYKEGAN